MTNDVMTYPAIGLIVEGHGEFNCFPSLVCRIVENHVYVKLEKATNNNSIIKDLEKYIEYLVLAHHPFVVVVTLDLRDTGVGPGGCGDLRKTLQQRADDWLKNTTDTRLHPLPKSIQVILQVQTFESWLLADIEQLKSLGYVSTGAKLQDSDLIDNPLKYLKENKGTKEYCKAPKLVKEIVSTLNIEEMSKTSRSFRKFKKEIALAYQAWQVSFEASVGNS